MLGIIIVVLLVVALLYFFILSLSKHRSKKRIFDFYKAYSPNGLQLVRRLENMFDNNECFSWGGEFILYKQMFNDLHSTNLEEFDKAIGINGYAEEPPGSPKNIACEYITILSSDLSQRYSLQYLPLQAIGKEEALKKFGINILINEYIYENIKLVDWFEERTITTSYNYGGLQYRLGNYNGLSYRMGNLSVTPITSDRFEVVDRGTLYISNKRIIFVGTEKKINKSINLDDILEFSIFRNGILIGKSNAKKPLIQFPEWLIQIGKAPNRRDDLNRTVRVLDRVIQKNQDKQMLTQKEES